MIELDRSSRPFQVTWLPMLISSRLKNDLPDVIIERCENPRKEGRPCTIIQTPGDAVLPGSPFPFKSNSSNFIIKLITLSNNPFLKLPE